MSRSRLWIGTYHFPRLTTPSRHNTTQTRGGTVGPSIIPSTPNAASRTWFSTVFSLNHHLHLQHEACESAGVLRGFLTGSGTFFCYALTWDFHLRLIYSDLKPYCTLPNSNLFQLNPVTAAEEYWSKVKLCNLHLIGFRQLMILSTLLSFK